MLAQPRHRLDSCPTPFECFDARTCDFVPNQLARLHLADRVEQAANVLLGHCLRQIVDDQIRLAILQRPIRRVGAVRAATILVHGRRRISLHAVHVDVATAAAAAGARRRVRGGGSVEIHGFGGGRQFE